jgi:hypothetical protein
MTRFLPSVIVGTRATVCVYASFGSSSPASKRFRVRCSLSRQFHADGSVGRGAREDHAADLVPRPAPYLGLARCDEPDAIDGDRGESRSRRHPDGGTMATWHRTTSTPKSERARPGTVRRKRRVSYRTGLRGSPHAHSSGAADRAENAPGAPGASAL